MLRQCIALHLILLWWINSWHIYLIHHSGLNYFGDIRKVQPDIFQNTPRKCREVGTFIFTPTFVYFVVSTVFLFSPFPLCFELLGTWTSGVKERKGDKERQAYCFEMYNAWKIFDSKMHSKYASKLCFPFFGLVYVFVTKINQN